MNREFTPIAEDEISRILGWLAGEENFVFLETLKGDAGNRCSRIFVRPERLIRCRRDQRPREFFSAIDQARSNRRFIAGYISYEFGYLLEERLSCRLDRGLRSPLAEVGVYRNHIVIDHRESRISPFPWDDGAGVDLDCDVADLRLNIDRGAYFDDIARIKGFIESGDTYQVNYTLKYHFSFQGSPLALYRQLRRRQSVAYAALIRSGGQWIISLSPELFFRVEGNTCTVKPMKGTCDRGRTVAEDRDLARELAADEKNRAENVMIVDLLRNDLGRLCVGGGVRAESMFDVEPFETLQQMTSTIRGELVPGAGAAGVIGAMFPCGSVTGAPKLRTMEIINELERGERGVYTGAIGWWGPDGDCCFNVPIRTAVIRDGRGEMGIGSGIVYDSDPAGEWRECLLKGDFLTAAAEDFRLIETMLYRRAGGFWLLEPHLARLCSSAGYFNFVYDPERIRVELAAATVGLDGDFRVRLLLDRDGGLEISRSPCGVPNLFIDPGGDCRPVAWAGERSDSSSRFFYHKTTRRELYDQAIREARSRGCFDLIFVNERGEVSEGAISNLFILRNGEILTPAAACGLLPGILRGELLRDGVETRAGEILPVREAVLTPEEVEAAEAVFLGNSVRGIVRVEFI